MSQSCLATYSRVIVIAILIMHVVLVSGYGHGSGRTTRDSFVLFDTEEESTTKTLTDPARMHGQQIHCFVSLSFCRATAGRILLLANP